MLLTCKSRSWYRVYYYSSAGTATSWTISFDSVEGVGTTFVVTFPQKIKSAEVIVVETVENDMKTTSRVDTPQKVDCADKDVLLLIEDDKDMREYLTDSLSSEYKVVMAMDGGQGLEMAKEMKFRILLFQTL